MFVVMHNKKKDAHKIIRIVTHVSPNVCMRLANIGFKTVSVSQKTGKCKMEFQCEWDKTLLKN